MQYSKDDVVAQFTEAVMSTVQQELSFAKYTGPHSDPQRVAQYNRVFSQVYATLKQQIESLGKQRVAHTKLKQALDLLPPSMQGTVSKESDINWVEKLD